MRHEVGDTVFETLPTGALTHDAAEISGMQYIMDADKAQAEELLDE